MAAKESTKGQDTTGAVCDDLCKMFSLTGKKAVVTGGSGVLGTDMARAGANVVPWDVEDALQASAERIKKEARRTDGIEYRKVDLMNEAEMFTATDAAGYPLHPRTPGG